MTAMQISSEDLLRLNVLLANDVEAIRIDEQSMTVYGLSGENEARVPLNPNCRSDQYLRRVREVLSSHVLGSPGGYPVFLQRWTRMGQTKDAQLGKLLLLGEPEAIVAVAGAPGLTDELARRAWWAMSTADTARRMLHAPAVVAGEMGKILARYLVDHLAFETEPANVVTTVRLVLQPGLIDAAQREGIWVKGTHRNAYHLGFLEANPNDLPQQSAARAHLADVAAPLAGLTEQGNTVAGLLAQLLDERGQSYLCVSESLLAHPVSQDTASMLLNNIGHYFSPARIGRPPPRDIDAIVEHAASLLQEGPEEVKSVVSALPGLSAEIRAMLTLAHASEEMIIPIVAKTTASGTLLTRKLEPVTAPLLSAYAALRGQTSQAVMRRR